MHSRFRFLALTCAGILATVSAPVAAGTLLVNGVDDPLNDTFAKLSAAVAMANASTTGPHTINVTVDHADDAPILISVPMTIDGNPNSVPGHKADILVGMSAIRTAANVGNPNPEPRCYIEIWTSGLVTISDLKIHPDEDLADQGATDAAKTRNAVDGIRMYEPAAGTGDYILNRVWVSGSNGSNEYIDLATSNEIWSADGLVCKKWSWNVGGGTVASGTNAVIQTVDNNAGGNINVALNNCMAGMGKSNAVNLGAIGGTAVITGGLYGHTRRDGIRVIGDGVTLKGTPTNRMRVVRSTCGNGGDGHAIEIYSNNSLVADVSLIEYVDIVGMNSSQNLKIWGDVATAGIVKLGAVRFVRCFGKIDTNAANLVNPTVLLKGNVSPSAGFTNPLIENCTFLGVPGTAATSLNPLASDADIAGSIIVRDCILASVGTDGYINLLNGASDTDGLLISYCAVPTDQYTGESLNVDPIRGVETEVNVATLVSASPHFMETLGDYDWSEGAVSVDGSDPNAGNPNVLRPGNYAAYAGMRSDAGNLVGGAGGTEVPVTVSGFTID